MNKIIYFVASSLLLSPQLSQADDAAPAQVKDAQQLQQEIDDLQIDYDQRLQRIEKRLKQTQVATRTKRANSFNPAISLILNGQYAAYSNNPDDYTLPGFALNDEAGLDPKGFSLGESEVTMAASVDQLFYGQATFSFVDTAGETSIETEEAYFETLALPHGLKMKAGRFYSAIGYLNEKHTHAWAFGDAPLIYRGLFGDQLTEDGVQLSWLLPTDRYFLVGGEVGNGEHYPSAGNHPGIGDWLVFAKTGGDLGLSHSWQLGLSHWQANDVKGRQSQGLNDPSYNGDSRIEAIDVVYKWAPDGNGKQQNLRLQAEFFHRKEDGIVSLNDTAQSSSYDGTQNGWYAQAVYQFIPRWKAGLRYDRLNSDNTGSDTSVLQQANLLEDGHIPKRVSVMLAWQPSEFSRIRAQYNRDDSSTNADNQFFLEYTMALGAHGAHSY